MTGPPPTQHKQEKHTHHSLTQSLKQAVASRNDVSGPSTPVSMQFLYLGSIFVAAHPLAFITGQSRSSDQKIRMKCYLILRKLYRTRKIFLKIILRPCKINLRM